MVAKKRAPSMPDHSMATELCLFIENDGQLYRQMYRPIIKNFARKVVSKKFNRTLAIRGVVHLVNEGARRYRKEFGLPAVSQSTKEQCARLLLSGMVSELREETTRLIMAKAAKKAPTRRKR